MGITFTGRWDSNFHEMDLRQDGLKVWGKVSYREGSLEGQLDGDVLRFRWYQREPNRQSGRGYLQISPDGQHLEGRWGYGQNDSDGGRWWADRAEGPTTTPTQKAIPPQDPSLTPQ
jgi:hypothetical protein